MTTLETHLSRLTSANTAERVAAMRALHLMMPIDPNLIRSALKNDDVLRIVQEALGEHSRFRSEMKDTELFGCIQDAFATMHRAHEQRELVIPDSLKAELEEESFIRVMMKYIGTNNDTKKRHVFTHLLDQLSEMSGELLIRDKLDVAVHKWKASVDEHCFRDFIHAHPKLFDAVRQFSQHYTTSKARQVDHLIQQIYPKHVVHKDFMTEEEIDTRMTTLKAQMRQYIECVQVFSKIVNAIVIAFRLEINTHRTLHQTMSEHVWTHMPLELANEFLNIFDTVYNDTLRSFGVLAHKKDIGSKNCDYTPKNKAIVMRLSKSNGCDSMLLAQFCNVFCAFVETTYIMHPSEPLDIDMWNWTLRSDEHICMAIMGKGYKDRPTDRKQCQQRQKHGRVFIHDFEQLEQSLTKTVQPTIPSPWFWSRENLLAQNLITEDRVPPAVVISPEYVLSTPPYHCAETAFLDADWASANHADSVQARVNGSNWETVCDCSDALEFLHWKHIGPLEHVTTATYNALLLGHERMRLSPFTVDGPNRYISDAVYAHCEQMNKINKMQGLMQNYRMRVWMQYYAMYYGLFGIDPHGVHGFETSTDMITSRPDSESVTLDFAGVYKTTITSAFIIARNILDMQLDSEFTGCVVKASSNKLLVFCATRAHAGYLLKRYGGEFEATHMHVKTSRIRIRNNSIATFVALHFLLREFTRVETIGDNDVIFPPAGCALALPWQVHMGEYYIVDVHRHKHELTLYDAFTEIGHRHPLKDTSAQRHAHVRFRQPSAVLQKMRRLYTVVEQGNRIMIANPFLVPTYAVAYHYNDMVRLLQAFDSTTNETGFLPDIQCPFIKDDAHLRIMYRRLQFMHAYNGEERVAPRTIDCRYHDALFSPVFVQYTDRYERALSITPCHETAVIGHELVSLDPVTLGRACITIDPDYAAPAGWKCTPLDNGVTLYHAKPIENSDFIESIKEYTNKLRCSDARQRRYAMLYLARVVCPTTALFNRYVMDWNEATSSAPIDMPHAFYMNMVSSNAHEIISRHLGTLVEYYDAIRPSGEAVSDSESLTRELLSMTFTVDQLVDFMYDVTCMQLIKNITDMPEYNEQGHCQVRCVTAEAELSRPIRESGTGSNWCAGGARVQVIHKHAYDLMTAQIQDLVVILREGFHSRHGFFMESVQNETHTGIEFQRILRSLLSAIFVFPPSWLVPGNVRVRTSASTVVPKKLTIQSAGQMNKDFIDHLIVNGINSQFTLVRNHVVRHKRKRAAAETQEAKRLRLGAVENALTVWRQSNLYDTTHGRTGTNEQAIKTRDVFGTLPMQYITTLQANGPEIELDIESHPKIQLTLYHVANEAVHVPYPQSLFMWDVFAGTPTDTSIQLYDKQRFTFKWVHDKQSFTGQFNNDPRPILGHTDLQAYTGEFTNIVNANQTCQRMTHKQSRQYLTLIARSGTILQIQFVICLGSNISLY